MKGEVSIRKIIIKNMNDLLDRDNVPVRYDALRKGEDWNAE